VPKPKLLAKTASGSCQNSFW